MCVVFPHCKFDIIKIDLLFGARWHAIVLKLNPALWQWPTRHHLDCVPNWPAFCDSLSSSEHFWTRCKDSYTCVRTVMRLLFPWGSFYCSFCVCFSSASISIEKNNKEHITGNLGTDHQLAGCYTTCLLCSFLMVLSIDWLTHPFIQPSLQSHRSKIRGFGVKDVCCALPDISFRSYVTLGSSRFSQL